MPEPFFSGCIEFENQELVYHHDQEKDEIRMTLSYEGIFGNLKKVRTCKRARTTRPP